MNIHVLAKIGIAKESFGAFGARNWFDTGMSDRMTSQRAQGFETHSACRTEVCFEMNRKTKFKFHKQTRKHGNSEKDVVHLLTSFI